MSDPEPAAPGRHDSATSGTTVTETLFCPDCGYDLRGIEASDRCPECGLAIDREAMTTSRIPWAHRDVIGRFRGYWRTVWMSVVNTPLLAREVARPVGYADAQRFRVITAVLAALVPAGLLGLGMWHEGHAFAAAMQLPDPLAGSTSPTAGLLDLFLPWLAGVTLWPVLPVAALLFALAASGVPSYWFHPSHLPVIRQNRAIAISHYASAPLVLLILPAVCWISAALVEQARLPRHAEARLAVLLGLAGGALVFLVLAIYVVNLLRLLRQAALAGAARIVWAVVGMPIAWAACAVVTFGFVPWCIGLLRLVLDGFRS